jgi:hypothetical protein
MDSWVESNHLVFSSDQGSDIYHLLILINVFWYLPSVDTVYNKYFDLYPLLIHYMYFDIYPLLIHYMYFDIYPLLIHYLCILIFTLCWYTIYVFWYLPSVDTLYVFWYLPSVDTLYVFWYLPSGDTVCEYFDIYPLFILYICIWIFTLCWYCISCCCL